MWITFSDQVGLQTQVHLKSWERGIHDQHSLTQLDQKGIEYYYRVDCITTHMSLSNSRALTWVCVCILFLIKLGSWVLVTNASLSRFQVNLCLNPNSIRKRYPHLVFCIVGLKVDLEDHFPWIWVHDFAVLRSFTRPHLHTSKSSVSAPHSSWSPHLAQTEQVRLTRFFCIAGLQHIPKGHN